MDRWIEDEGKKDIGMEGSKDKRIDGVFQLRLFETKSRQNKNGK